MERLHQRDDASRIPPEFAAKIRRILFRLDAAAQPSDMNLPGWGLHKLRGNLRDHWAVRVSGNWRITFRFQSGHAREVNLIDYH